MVGTRDVRRVLRRDGIDRHIVDGAFPYVAHKIGDAELDTVQRAWAGILPKRNGGSSDDLRDCGAAFTAARRGLPRTPRIAAVCGIHIRRRRHVQAGDGILDLHRAIRRVEVDPLRRCEVGPVAGRQEIVGACGVVPEIVLAERLARQRIGVINPVRVDNDAAGRLRPNGIIIRGVGFQDVVDFTQRIGRERVLPLAAGDARPDALAEIADGVRAVQFDSHTCQWIGRNSYRPRIDVARERRDVQSTQIAVDIHSLLGIGARVFPSRQESPAVARGDCRTHLIDGQVGDDDLAFRLRSIVGYAATVNIDIRGPKLKRPHNQVTTTGRTVGDVGTVLVSGITPGYQKVRP